MFRLKTPPIREKYFELNLSKISLEEGAEDKQEGPQVIAESTTSTKTCKHEGICVLE